MIFSKGSYILIFIFLEFFSAIRFFFVQKLWLFKEMVNNKTYLIQYTFFPLAFVLIYKVLINKAGASQLHLFFDKNKLLQFNSLSPIYPFVAVYGLLLIYLILNYKKNNWNIMVVLGSSLANFILYYAFQQSGNSEVYFMFNAFILNFII